MFNALLPIMVVDDTTVTDEDLFERAQLRVVITWKPRNERKFVVVRSSPTYKLF